VPSARVRRNDRHHPDGLAHVKLGTITFPNTLERDTVIRVAGPEGQVGDSISEVKPVETFDGEAVIEGMY
jgi:hypothetical protein